MCVDTLIQLNSLYFSIPHAIFQNVNKIQLLYSGLLNTQNPSISVNMQKADYDQQQISHSISFIHDGYTYPDREVVELAVKIQHLLSPNKDLTLIVAGTVHIITRGVMFLEGCYNGLESRLTSLHELQGSVSNFVHVPIKQQLAIPREFVLFLAVNNNQLNFRIFIVW